MFSCFFLIFGGFCFAGAPHIWVKRGFVSDTTSKFIITSGSAGTNFGALGFNNDGSTPAFNFKEMANGSGTAASSPDRHRDFSAWYHLVATNDTSGVQKLWINGRLSSQTNGTGSVL